MIKQAYNGLCVAMLLLWGCGPTIPDKVEDGRGTSDGGTPIESLTSDRSTYDAPPHRFRPRAHVPKERTYVSSTGDVGRIPSVSLRMGQCFGMYEDEELAIASPVTSSRKSAGRASSGKKKSKSRPKRKSAILSGAASQSAPRSEMDSLLGGEAAKESAPLASPSEAEKVQGAMPESVLMEDSVGEDMPQIAVDDDISSDYEDWGAAIYLSNDDSMSLSSAQRVIFAIDHFLPLPLEHIRPHELLNYFSFETSMVQKGHDFSVLADVAADDREEGIYNLGLAVSGRPVNRANRRNVALTWVIDRSGSMSSEGRMEYLKRGMLKSLKELKRGDVVHMVLFDHNICTPVENFVVGRDNIADVERAISALTPMGSTNIHKGLSQGYEIADRSYLPHHSNRVLLITDALANTGVTDEQMISMISRYYESRRIRLSGVGVGREFNDGLLDRLTEKGKGAYVFLGSEAEVDAVFGNRFISLIETTALDVHFRLHLPESLRMNVFYGEESSTLKEDVQAIHYFANTSQFFLSDLMARGGALRGQDDIMMTIEYEDPETGDTLFEEYAWNLGEIQSRSAYNLKKGRLLMSWIDMLAQMAARPSPGYYGQHAGSWVDPDGYGECEDGRAELSRLAEGLGDDPETHRVLQLWDKYCSRYERPRNPVRRQVVQPGDSWPAATPIETR